MTKKEYLQNLKEAIILISDLPFYQLDNDVKMLQLAFDIAYEYKLFALYNFEPKLQDELKLKLFEKLSVISGNLSFLGIQILAANAIMKKNNFKHQEKFFNKKCGIAINHLRTNKTIVDATKCEGGYKLNGVLTWASGYKIFNHLLIGFHFQNREYEVMSGFKKTKGFEILGAPKTFVGYGLNTVNIILNDYFVSDKNLISSNDIGNYTKNKSLSKTIHYSLYGLGCGALKHIESPTLKKYLKKELKVHKKAFIKSCDGNELDQQRVTLFNFLQKVITTGMIQNGGKSILKEKHLQQYYRELIMFNSNGLNKTIKELFLNACIKD